MKSTGIIRRVDELGRVVLPIALRRKHGISEKDPIEIWVDGSNIVLKKEEKTCLFCGTAEKGLIEYQQKRMCKKCKGEIIKLTKENVKSRF